MRHCAIVSYLLLKATSKRGWSLIEDDLKCMHSIGNNGASSFTQIKCMKAVHTHTHYYKKKYNRRTHDVHTEKLFLKWVVLHLRNQTTVWLDIAIAVTFKAWVFCSRTIYILHAFIFIIIFSGDGRGGGTGNYESKDPGLSCVSTLHRHC